MKKSMQIAAGVAVAALALTGCAGTSDGGGAKDSKTIELWTSWTEGADTAVAGKKKIEEFEERTGYTVNETNFTYDMMRSKLIASAAGGNLPDVVFGLPEWVGEFSKLGILADMSGTWDAWEDHDQVSDAVKSAMTIDGKVVGLPYSATVRAYLVHDDLLAKAGVETPTTWEDVVAIGSKVQDATGSSAYGVAGTGVRAPQELVGYLAQQGLTIADAQDGGGYRNTWQDDAASLKKAASVFQFYEDIFASGAVNANSATYGWEQTDENFATGLTATYVSGNWLAEREKSNADAMADVSVHPIPYPSDGQQATYIEAKPVFVMSSAKNPTGATELAQTIASQDFQQAAFPDRSALDSVTTDSKWSKDFKPLIESSVTYPPVSMAGITQAMIDALAMVLQEGKSPEEAATWLSDSINASLEKSGDASGS